MGGCRRTTALLVSHSRSQQYLFIGGLLFFSLKKKKEYSTAVQENKSYFLKYFLFKNVLK
jgi:hypothetical protein